MRKNSKQIYQEILLDKEINKFEHRDKLLQCIDDMLNFRVNELDALMEALELTKDNQLLKDYVMANVITHSRNIMAVLGVTSEGFRMGLEDLDKAKEAYDKIRNSVSKQVLN